MVQIRDSDDDQGDQSGHGKAKIAATVLVLGIPVVRDLAEIVAVVLDWFN